jgi:hypothetical protein
LDCPWTASSLSAGTLASAEKGLRNLGRECVVGGLEEGIHSVDRALDQIVRIGRDCQLEGVRRSQVAYRSPAVVVPDDPVASYVDEHQSVDSRVWRGIGFGEMARGSRVVAG